MKKLPHFKFYPNDFLGGVAYLSMSERGAYITLLCYEWDCGPIPKKRLGFLLGSDWELIWDGIKSKFRENADGTISNDRLESEREKAAQFAEKQLNNGSKGGRPKAKPNPNDNPNDNPNESLLDNDNGNDNGNDNRKEKGLEKENQFLDVRELFASETGKHMTQMIAKNTGTAQAMLPHWMEQFTLREESEDPKYRTNKQVFAAFTKYLNTVKHNETQKAKVKPMSAPAPVDRIKKYYQND